MSRKADPAAIGAFVVGATIIAIASVLFFGSGRLFRDASTHVSFFPGSIKGLDVGAPVTFRGVRVGSVLDIQAVYDVPNDMFYLPVIFEIEDDHFQTIGEDSDLSWDPQDEQEAIRHLIGIGLRARLEMRSLLTGQLNIELDMFPGSPVNLSNHPSPYTEIPTLPTGIEQLIDRIKKFFGQIEDMPLADIAQDMADALRGIDELISSERTASIFQGVDELVNSPELQASLVNLNRALISFEAAMSTTRAFVEDADGQLEPIAEHVMKASRGLEDALTDTRSILLDVRNSISEDSRLRTVTNRAMEELEAAARSIRILADYLERHPESLIKGKPNPGGDR
jgi:paraquat-inducible protein B